MMTTKSSRVEEFQREYPKQYEVLRKNESAPDAAFNRFYSSLWEQLNSKGYLSDRQLSTLTAGIEADRRAAEQRSKAAPVVDLTSIKKMFDAAHASGYKRPTYRAEGLVLSRAPDAGRNPGSLYVKSDNAEELYLGRVFDLKFHSTRDGDAYDALARLVAIAADPKGAAVAYGRATGRCACCGRLLTDPKSVELGIGPICADRWGFGG